MALSRYENVLHRALKDLLSAETQFRDARPNLAKAAEGPVEEGQALIEEGGEAPFKGIALAAGGRKVEHYEIVSCIDAIEHAKALGHGELADLLGTTLAEEQAAGQNLARITQSLSAKARRSA